MKGLEHVMEKQESSKNPSNPTSITSRSVSSAVSDRSSNDGQAKESSHQIPSRKAGHQAVLWRFKCRCGQDSLSWREERAWLNMSLRRLLTPHFDGPPRLPALPGLPLPQLPPPDQLKQIAKALNSGDLAVHIDLGPAGSMNVRLPSTRPDPRPREQQPLAQQEGPQLQRPPAGPVLQQPQGVKLSELGVDDGPGNLPQPFG